MMRRCPILRRFIRDRKGAVAVEFALILPLIIAVIMGIVEFGRILWIRNTMEFVAETAARWGGINTSATAAEIEDYARTQILALDGTGWVFVIDPQASYVSITITHTPALMSTTIATGMPTRVAIISTPIRHHSTANQNVRICQRKCDSSQVPRTSPRFT